MINCFVLLNCVDFASDVVGVCHSSGVKVPNDVKLLNLRLCEPNDITTFIPIYEFQLMIGFIELIL